MLTGQYKKTKLVTVILLSVLLTTNVFAKPLHNLGEKIKSEIPKKYIQNLAIGIESENTGLKRSCIYFAGFYEIEEVVGTLIGQLKKETDADTRILIALSLYKIGSKEALEAFKGLVNNDHDSKVRKMSTKILNEFNVSSSEKNK
jgi:HEAT repeat protein